MIERFDGAGPLGVRPGLEDVLAGVLDALVERCSVNLGNRADVLGQHGDLCGRDFGKAAEHEIARVAAVAEIGRASCRERVCYVV